MYENPPFTESHRRLLLKAGAMAAALSSLPNARAADAWPTKPIRFVVPFPPGGTTDFVTRAVAAEVSRQVGQPAVVENRPGAGTVIGVDNVAKSAPDGYTFGCVAGSFCVNHTLARKLPYDTFRDLRAVALMGESEHALCAHPSTGLKSLADLKARALAKPGTLTYASFGIGTTPHLSSEMLKAQMGGLQITHVPYKGQGPAIADLLGGQVNLMFASWLDAREFVKQGRLNVLGMATVKRSQFAPEVPTLKEQGVDIESATWCGLITPAGTPDAIVERMNVEVNKALKVPSLVASFNKSSVALMPGSVADFTAFIRREADRNAAIIRSANIQADG